MKKISKKMLFCSMMVVSLLSEIVIQVNAVVYASEVGVQGSEIYQDIDTTSIEDNIQIQVTNNDANVDIQKMSSEERNNFLNWVDSEVANKTEMTDEEKENYRKTLIGIFDSNSENYQDGMSLEEAVNGSSKFRATRIMSVGVAGTLINGLIAAITGGALSAYIRKKGFSAFALALESRVMATIRVKQVGKVIKGLVSTITAIANPGLAIAKGIDKIDAKRNSGWLEV